MTMLKRYTFSGARVTDRTIGGFSAVSSLAPLREEVLEPPQEEVWPIGLAGWSCIGLGAVCWAAVGGLVAYFFFLLS